MNVIRDEECNGLFMIPLLVDWKIRRCNVAGCTNKPNTIIAAHGIEGVPVFGLCEEHHQECVDKQSMNFTLDFDKFDAFA